MRAVRTRSKGEWLLAHRKGKVAINGRFLTQEVTGVQRYAIELVKALDRLVSEADPAVEAYSFELLAPRRELKQNLGLRSIPVRQVGRLGGHLWEQLELPYYVRKRCLLSLCNAGPLAKRNQVVTVHDAAVFANPQNFSLRFRTWYKLLLVGLGRTAARVATVSSFSKKELIRYCKMPEAKLRVTLEGGEHVLSVPTDKEILQRQALEHRPFVLAVSSLSPNKNFRAVVRAAELLGDTDFDVVVVGGTNPRIFSRSGQSLPDSVKHTGYVSDGELRALYESAACFIYPSFYEGFGLPPLEAMSCGCPTIASGTASMPEVCGDAVLYCDPGDPADIARNIRQLMQDKSLREDMRTKGLQRAHGFSWEGCARETVSVVDELSIKRP